MDKEKLIKELTKLVKSKKHHTHLGMRIETEELDTIVNLGAVIGFILGLINIFF